MSTPATVIEDDDDDLLNGTTTNDGLEVDYYFDDTAYILMLLHAFKNPSSPVLGILLGKPSPYNKSQYTISKIIPLSHSDLSLFTTPLTEICLTLTETYCTLNGLNILGLYYAPSIVGTQPPRQVTRIIDKIHENGSLRNHTSLFCMDAERLVPSRRKEEQCIGTVRMKRRQESKFAAAKDSAQNVSVFVSDKGLHVADLVLLNPNSRERITSHVAKFSNYDVADFEDHCINAGDDYFNANVMRQIDVVLDNPNSTPNTTPTASQ